MHTKFFSRTPSSNMPNSWKHFLMPNMRFFIIFDVNSSKTWKMQYPWTFARIKIFWDVVWSRQTPCWIAYDLRNTLQTYLVVKRCVKRTEMSFLCETWFSKINQNCNFHSKIAWKWLWEALKTKKSHKKCHFRAFNASFDHEISL